jgi:transposase
MFWDCISMHGTGPLVSVQGTLDQREYITILRDELLPEFLRAKRAIPGTWHLMHDNAPCHRAKAVETFPHQNGIDLIKWPPYSPDLNPIENL